MKKQTIAIHTPYVRPDAYGALAVPIYNNVSFEFQDAQEMSDAFCNRIKAPDYARIANPTVTQFEQRVKALTEAEHVTAFNSGMAAISTALLAVVSQGKNIVTSRHLFGNTLAFISGTLLRLGIKPRLRDLTDLEAVEQAIDEQTACVFLEIVTNPQLEVADLKAIADIAHRKGVPVIADSTVIPFTETDLKALGVDVEVVSSTKYISGGGTSLGGLIIDYGTFPYVTASNSSGVGISAGSGVPARYIDRLIGIVKAYTTRVGGGPFPTELDNEIGQKIRDRGNEYGTVTKRPRRCGWFDAVAARYTARLSGVTEISLMLLDVLSTFDEINICTAYEIDGKTTTHFPANAEDLRRVKPILEPHPGWSEDITKVAKFADLPENARKYVARISEIIGKPISMVSVGPSREQTITVE